MYFKIKFYLLNIMIMIIVSHFVNNHHFKFVLFTCGMKRWLRKDCFTKKKLFMSAIFFIFFFIFILSPIFLTDTFNVAVKKLC